jgi:hypothetical protein
MEIEKNELDKEWLGSWAIYIWNQWMEFCVINCQLKELKRVRPTSFILHMTYSCGSETQVLKLLDENDYT